MLVIVAVAFCERALFDGGLIYDMTSFRGQFPGLDGHIDCLFTKGPPK